MNARRGGRAGKHWWKDINLVKREFLHFCEANSLDTHVLPSTEQLRTTPGGNYLAHAITMYGGVGNLSHALGIPSFSAGRRFANVSILPAAAQDESVVVANSPCSHTRGLSHAPHGYYADSERFRQELIAFGQQQTNNPYWKVLPSAAQMRRCGRCDLVQAIHRYGGSEAVAARFGMLSAAEYSYHYEFYSFLRELKSYQEATGQVGKMPALTHMKRDGRADLVRLVRKHGGQQVLAARLCLKLDRERSPRMLWGPFDLDFAIDLLNVSQAVALDVGNNRRMLLPTDDDLAVIGRPDLSTRISEYGGRADVARRLGRLLLWLLLLCSLVVVASLCGRFFVC